MRLARVSTRLNLTALTCFLFLKFFSPRFVHTYALIVIVVVFILISFLASSRTVEIVFTPFTDSLVIFSFVLYAFIMPGWLVWL